MNLPNPGPRPFTPKLLEVEAAARQEGERVGAARLGPWELLIGLCQESAHVAHALGQFGITPERLRQRREPPGDEGLDEALRLAWAETRRNLSAYGLLRGLAGTPTGARILEGLGVDPQLVRAERMDEEDLSLWLLGNYE